MKRTLSVPSLKFLFLARAIGAVLGAAVALYVLAKIQEAGGVSPVLSAIRVYVVVVIGALVVKDQLMRRRLRRVAVDDQFLYVSNYSDSSEVAIPLSDVVRVTQWRGQTFRPVSIYLRSPSKFGTRIRFQPKPEWGWDFTENSVVDELRKMAHLH